MNDNISGAGGVAELKCDFGLCPEQVIARLPATNGDGRGATVIAKTFAINSDDCAFVVLAPNVGAAIQIGKENPWLLRPREYGEDGQQPDENLDREFQDNR